ncbi:MAG TPA: DUF4381 domain-containing protein [Nitrospirales bacterium]|nr:DUF4381 domain-containing protein [Nitrospirales bacterium]
MDEIHGRQDFPSLPGLHDIVMPEPVAWVPQTPGWYLVAFLLSVGLVWTAVCFRRRWMLSRYRKSALIELDRIEALALHPESQVKGLAELPVLVKRTALSFKSREEVAALTGEAWLRFLDTSYGGTGFAQGVGRLLIHAGYEVPTSSPHEKQEKIVDLFRLVRYWIRRHHA